MSDISKCPVMGHANTPAASNAGRGTSNRDWWPKQLKLNILHQHSTKSNPLGSTFNYAEAFKQLDLNAVKQDLKISERRYGNAAFSDLAFRQRPAEAATRIWARSPAKAAALAGSLKVGVLMGQPCPRGGWKSRVEGGTAFLWSGTRKRP